MGRGGSGRWEGAARRLGGAVPGFLRPVPEMRVLSLRFFHRDLERSFQRSYFRDNLPYMRVAYLLGIAVWASFGVLAQFLLEEGGGLDLFIRFGVAIPSVLVGLALTYTRAYERIWQPTLVAVIVFSALVWTTHRVIVEEARQDWGYAGIMLILVFAYMIARLQFVYAVLTGAIVIAVFNVVTVVFTHDSALNVLFADFFLVTTAIVGMASAYILERFTRLVFLREKELERERRRSEDLLRNILPDAVVDRLKRRHSSVEAELIAEGLDEVTVLFVDLVGFTSHSERTLPSTIVESLDRVFTRFDELADRFGLEKIKTVGDAYMAAAGAPEPSPDHVEAAADMALGVREVLSDSRWPNGDPLAARIGIATGPVVAGVIGRRKFAYDLWGDTVNTASRLEAQGVPGEIQVTERVAEVLGDDYIFSEPHVVGLKGKGPTRARFLLGRAGDERDDSSLAEDARADT